MVLLHNNFHPYFITIQYNTMIQLHNLIYTILLSYIIQLQYYTIHNIKAFIEITQLYKLYVKL